MNPINSKPLPDGVEENVAGIHDGLVKIDDAMPRRPPAVEDSSVKISVARTIGSEVSRQLLGLKHRRGHDDLENRPRGKLTLNGTIQQWRPFIGIESSPFRCWNSDGKIFGIESRAADHRQDFSGSPVH